jgi:hypothetical protein
MKSKIPRSVRLTETTETRLSGLFKECAGLAFPEILNIAVDDFIDRWNAGERPVWTPNGMRLRVLRESENVDSRKESDTRKDRSLDPPKRGTRKSGIGPDVAFRRSA